MLLKLIFKSTLIWIIVFFAVSIIIVGKYSDAFQDGMDTMPRTIGVHTKQYQILGISYMEASKVVTVNSKDNVLGDSYTVIYTNGAFIIPSICATLILVLSLSYELYGKRKNG